jgi:tetratricopeptide (TPR) repeat protein
MFFAIILLTVWLRNYRNENSHNVSPKPLRIAKFKNTNKLRRIKYEYNEERFLMACDIDLQNTLQCGDIKITYGLASNRHKVDYWRNVDSIRHPQKNCITSKHYHAYCGNSMECAVCFSNANYPEIHLDKQSYAEIDNPQKQKLLNEFYDSVPKDKRNDFYIYRDYKYSTWLTIVGEEWLFEKNYKQARQWINKEIAIDPNASSYWARGETYEMEGDFQHAIDDYQIAWEYDPAYTYRVAKARTFLKMGIQATAATEYCFAICDIDVRCETNTMQYMRVFKYELLKSRLLACPLYLETSKICSLADIAKLLVANRNSLPEKEYLLSMKHLFWAIERERYEMKLNSNHKINEKNTTSPKRTWRFSPLVQ